MPTRTPAELEIIRIIAKVFGGFPPRISEDFRIGILKEISRNSYGETFEKNNMWEATGEHFGEIPDFPQWDL